MVTFRWFGQACFEIDDNISIVTDPHDGDSVGLKTPKMTGDIITVSHPHYDHNSGVELAKKKGSKLIKEARKFRIKGTRLEGFLTYHDKSEGEERGENVIFKFEIDGLEVCHLGDLGHMLDEELIGDLNTIDVLLIPVGGKFTIGGREAAKLTKKIEPKIVIPMHFKVAGLDVPISSPEKFLDQIQEKYPVEKVGKKFEIDSKPKEKKTVLIECSA